MNPDLIWKYIRARMAEKGYPQLDMYSFREFSIPTIDGNSTVRIKDDGAFYYPCWWSRNVFPTGGVITIKSENGFLSGNFEGWTTVDALEQYGNIDITVSGFTGPVAVEFIKVIVSKNVWFKN